MFEFKELDLLTDGEIDLRIEEKIGLEFKGVVSLPPHNEMYQRGEHQKCIYEWILG